MTILSNLDLNNINSVLSQYVGGRADIWLFEISLRKISIRITSDNKDKALCLVAANSKYIKGNFSWKNAHIKVVEFDSADGVMFKIYDEMSEFELICDGGIALAEGSDVEFG
jgi:hypothetical protein